MSDIIAMDLTLGRRGCSACNYGSCTGACTSDDYMEGGSWFGDVIVGYRQSKDYDGY